MATLTLNLHHHNERRWWILGILLAALFGLATWVVNPLWIMLALAGLGIVIWLLTKPDWMFLFTILAFPMIAVQYKFVHIADICLWLTVGGLTLEMLRKPPIARRMVSLWTPMDWWVIPLGIWFLIKGLTSLAPDRGLIYGLRFADSFIMYYLTVYFIRSGRLSLKTLLYSFIFSGTLEAALGMFQVTTGKAYLSPWGEMGAERGYFSFLGIGSQKVSQAYGFFLHFAGFGHFLVTTFAFTLTYRLFVHRSRWVPWILWLMFLAIVFSYSRGAMSCFISSMVYTLLLIPTRNERFERWLKICVASLLGLAMVLVLFTKYNSTLVPRDHAVEINLKFLKDNPDYMFWGPGLESVTKTVFNMGPAYANAKELGQVDSHSIIIDFLQSIGLVGTVWFLLGMATMYAQTLWTLWQCRTHAFAALFKRQFAFTRSVPDAITRTPAHHAYLAGRLAFNVSVVVIFIGGTNDHIYNEPYMFGWLLMMIAFCFAFPWKRYADLWISAFNHSPLL